jgi:AbrB family looped-hinge helix DNA binding protein
MTHRVGAKGQVVIPKSIRDELGIEPGDEVDFEVDGGAVRVREAASEADRATRVRKLRGMLKGVAGFSIEDFEADRREERRREEEKWQRRP